MAAPRFVNHGASSEAILTSCIVKTNPGPQVSDASFGRRKNEPRILHAEATDVMATAAIFWPAARMAGMPIAMEVIGRSLRRTMQTPESPHPRADQFVA